MIWIGYTTLYREGGPKFARAAATLAHEKRRAHPELEVRCERLESKREFVDAMARIAASGQTLSELHFIGHSGMYGPMFRTTSMPEQFSPHEWRQLQLPLTRASRAYFHACRTARWFAPFFARIFSVRAYGYHWYTTVSTQPDAFRWEGPRTRDEQAPLYLIACAGKKSHGLLGSLAKYSGLARAERMKEFLPAPPAGDPSYDSVAALYDRAFDDISVRAKECAFIEERLPAGRPRVLDLGCGNGALLERLSERIGESAGVDQSHAMIALARKRNAGREQLSFQAIDDPSLPFDDASFDVVISLLSFRYLDWDPIMNEIRRVLAPGGRLLIVDMVTVPAGVTELPRVAYGKLEQLLRHARRPAFARALRALVADPAFRSMLAHNPIRAEHELRWYLQSRYPGRTIHTLDVGYDARVLAFDSGPLPRGWVAPQSYP